MEYKRMTVKITHEKSPVGGISVFTDVHFGERKMEDILDIAVFFRALEKDGRQPLFTCSCGCFGCGGYYTDVECTEKAWILRNKYHPLGEKHLESFEYHVSWEQVASVADLIKDYVMQVARDNPGVMIMSGTISEIDLRKFFSQEYGDLQLCESPSQ
jgi:hypothetical protein